MTYFVSRGNSIGRYSDYIPANTHDSVESAMEWGVDQYDGDFVVWHQEWDEDQAEYVPVGD